MLVRLNDRVSDIGYRCITISVIESNSLLRQMEIRPMDTLPAQSTSSSNQRKGIALLAMVFGLATLFSSSNVLFGANEARALAGAYVPFVVWFNFIAGFLYVFVAIGIWLGRNWALGLSAFIAAATAVAALAFGFQVIQGGAFEMRTVGALTLRVGFWTVIALLLFRRAGRS